MTDTSDTTHLPELYSALAAAQGDVQSVEKDKTNEYSKYRYASADVLIDEARRALSAHGLSVIPVGYEVLSCEVCRGLYCFFIIYHLFALVIVLLAHLSFQIDPFRLPHLILFSLNTQHSFLRFL
jgi:hypothetical protein